MLTESSYSVDFALQFGKAWNRIFYGREFCNIFVLIRDSGLCLFVKKSLQRINSSFCSNQMYKSFRLIAGYFSSRNKIKFRHSFVSAQVFGLPSSTGPLGFPNKVCDSFQLTLKSPTFKLFLTIFPDGDFTTNIPDMSGKNRTYGNPTANCWCFSEECSII